MRKTLLLVGAALVAAATVLPAKASTSALIQTDIVPVTTCTGDECTSSVADGVAGGHPHLMMTFTPEDAGETDQEEQNNGDILCSNCKPCSSKISIWEDSSGNAYSYNGAGNRGNVSEDENAPSEFTLTSDCLDSAGKTIQMYAKFGGVTTNIGQFTQTCSGGCPE